MIDEPPHHEVTRLIQAAGASNSAAADQLLNLVYEQLRKIAQQRMSEERRDHTLQATALVHEVYLRLVGTNEVPWQGRAHFFAAAAEAMRRILIEHARARGRKKRAGPGRRLPMNVLNLAADADFEQIVSMDDAICRMEAEDAQLAQMVRLRFYAGLSVEETAEATNSSPATVMRRWAYARAWLMNALGAES